MTATAHAAATRASSFSCPDTVFLNSATQAQLECLPGVGAARAESILALRKRKGGYERVEELRGVRGLTERVLKGFQGRVRAFPAP
jgi:competence protein ComEA